MRGGRVDQIMFFFCPRSGYKNCPRRGGDQKMAKFCRRSCWITPYKSPEYLTKSAKFLKILILKQANHHFIKILHISCQLFHHTSQKWSGDAHISTILTFYFGLSAHCADSYADIDAHNMGNIHDENRMFARMHSVRFFFLQYIIVKLFMHSSSLQKKILSHLLCSCICIITLKKFAMYICHCVQKTTVKLAFYLPNWIYWK